jgi:ectoine hydroxylase-related dioxygenase (phytanoyl-CoA dioxygenase family)
MTMAGDVPEDSYGVLLREESDSVIDTVAEQVRNLGYAVLESGYSERRLVKLSGEFNQARARYIELYGESRLKELDEFHTIRALLVHGHDAFLKLALNENLLSVLSKLILGKFILNQQNGVINPPREIFNQGRWHRDLPYQHFVSTRPLAINALFCVDDFTARNGATFVLPGSHKSETFPSLSYIKRNAIQVQARAGSFILLDCMLFHAGGYNGTQSARRAVNHVYTIPYIKQQINLPTNLKSVNLSAEAKEIFGFDYQEPASIVDYFSGRLGKGY